ncbi:hypothetical protein T03_2612 [Trichinella britovi]|uniref:Uncharacterized protein n=1 Tax=Trichinella britovi TaxID=45882 RepID=A0A0V1AMI2_TRIBR|nr:hypothetical protein T03_2612 [Trichinella britovi]
MSIVIVAICTCLRTTRRQMIFRKLHIPASAQQKGPSFPSPRCEWLSL